MTGDQSKIDDAIRLLLRRFPRVIDNPRRFAKRVTKLLNLIETGLDPEEAIEVMREELSKSRPSVEEVRRLLNIQNPSPAIAERLDELAELLDDLDPPESQ